MRTHSWLLLTLDDQENSLRWRVYQEGEPQALGYRWRHDCWWPSTAPDRRAQPARPFLGESPKGYIDVSESEQEPHSSGQVCYG